MILTNAIKHNLEDTFQIAENQIDFYRKNRFIKLKNVLNPETIQFFNDVITKQVDSMNHEAVSYTHLRAHETEL
jgi:hypothetical protein